MKVRRSALSALAALFVSVSALAVSPAQAASPALSPWDAQLYSAAFDAVKRGDFSAAEAKLAQVKDRCLVGMVEFDKLLHPKAYKATYEELTSWLAKYGDLPVAPRVYALAKKRQPAGAPDPTAPTSTQAPRTWQSVETPALDPTTHADIDPLDPKAARLSLNAGDLRSALVLADASGDRWTGGLAAYRMKNYDEAFRHFQLVALDVSEEAWVRSRAGYWASRAAIARGAPDQAPELLRVAAQFPRTFYGQIAERQLGLEPRALMGALPYQTPASPVVRTSGSDLDSPAMQRFVQTEPRAKRALALAEVGQKVDAGMEIRAGLGQARDEDARRQWTTLALGVNAMFPNAGGQQGVDPHDYPMPDLAPTGGFTIDKALVFALIRQESRFNSHAHSGAGAYGLMQVMPSNAAWLERDPRYRKNPGALYDPATNLRIGQDYVLYLMSQPQISGDILKTVAAYDGGPAPVYETMKQLGPDADTLLMIESIPVPEARDYVQKVMANYWIYKRLLGQKTRTLDAVADGDHTAQVALDRVPPSPVFATATPAATATLPPVMHITIVPPKSVVNDPDPQRH
jgi:soluble lytic murein transglycosylase